MNLPQAMRLRREQLGLTQAQCAKRAGVSQPVWNRWERGHASPSIDTLVRIAHALKLRARSLL